MTDTLLVPRKNTISFDGQVNLIIGLRTEYPDANRNAIRDLYKQRYERQMNGSAFKRASIKMNLFQEILDSKQEYLVAHLIVNPGIQDSELTSMSNQFSRKGLNLSMIKRYAKFVYDQKKMTKAQALKIIKKGILNAS